MHSTQPEKRLPARILAALTPSVAQRAEYVGDNLRELRDFARGDDLARLRHLLSMASGEADLLAQEERARSLSSVADR